MSWTRDWTQRDMTERDGTESKSSGTGQDEMWLNFLSFKNFLSQTVFYNVLNSISFNQSKFI